jgi:ATPase related to the helicase subunit of the Holliday junction resolvase
LNLAQAAVYLAKAPKVERVVHRAQPGDGGGAGARRAPPARSASVGGYPGARKLGRGAGYVYPHDDPRGFEVDCLPDELKGSIFYSEDAGPEGGGD